MSAWYTALRKAADLLGSLTDPAHRRHHCPAAESDHVVESITGHLSCRMLLEHYSHIRTFANVDRLVSGASIGDGEARRAGITFATIQGARDQSGSGKDTAVMVERAPDGSDVRQLSADGGGIVNEVSVAHAHFAGAYADSDDPALDTSERTAAPPTLAPAPTGSTPPQPRDHWTEMLTRRRNRLGSIQKFAQIRPSVPLPSATMPVTYMESNVPMCSITHGDRPKIWSLNAEATDINRRKISAARDKLPDPTGTNDPSANRRQDAACHS